MLVIRGKAKKLEYLAVNGEYFQHFGTKRGKKLFRKPGIALEPQVVSRTGVRQRNRVRPVLSPCLNYLGERRTFVWQVVSLGILAYHQCELKILQV